MSDLEEVPATVGDNLKRHQLFQDVAEIGRQNGDGVQSVFRLGMRVIRGAADGFIEPDHAKDLFKIYAEASASAGGTLASLKTNTSKLRKLIELGCLPGGPQLAEDAMRMRNEVEKPKPPFDALVEVARQRIKLKRKLSADEIKTSLTKVPPKEKSKVGEKPADWKSVAFQIFTLMEVKTEEGTRAAYAIRAQCDNYLRDDSEETEADQATESPADVSTVLEANEVHEAAHTPPAVIVEEEENTIGEANE